VSNDDASTLRQILETTGISEALDVGEELVIAVLFRRQELGADSVAVLPVEVGDRACAVVNG
jgi:hypothetical protein